MTLRPSTRSCRASTAAAIAAVALAFAAAEASRAEAACGDLTASSPQRAVKSGGELDVVGTCASASATVGGPSALVQLRDGRSWRRVGRETVGADGSFSASVRVRVPRGTKVATLRVLVAGSAPKTIRVGVFPACKRDKKCRKKFGKRKPSPRGLIASDTAANPDPVPFWGSIDCENESRQQHYSSGGDPTPTGLGTPQGDSAFRRTTVFDGDDFWGERCEFGANNSRGPVTFFQEGERRLTYASFRLPHGFPIDTPNWQGVLQMKQAQPAANGGGAPVISLSAFQGQWSVWNSIPGYSNNDRMIWSAPARTGAWTRFMFDVTYSSNPSLGVIAISADVNGDGDFMDTGEQSGAIRTNTLKQEIGPDGPDGINAGSSIPSHLRAGIYHHDGISCPAPTGCSVDLDNVQVIAP